MRITITFEGSDVEVGALLEKLQEVFGDQVVVEVEGGAEVPPPPPPVVPPPVEPVPPPPPPVVPPPGARQKFKNPYMTGEQIVYAENLVGPKEWRITDHVGVPRPGGVTQAVRGELKRPETSFEGYDRYLQPEFGSTALEMGGAWRTFNWEVHQNNVPVRAGFAYDLMAAFHPLVKNKMPDGSEAFMNSDMAGDWMSNLEWRWVVRALNGDILAADVWQNGDSLGTTTFDLPFDSPHRYHFTWVAERDGTVTFGLEFRNKWPLAMTKVWLHGATCEERAAV